MAAAVADLLAERRPKGMVVLISDFLLTETDYETALTRLLAARHELKVLHVMGEREVAGSYPPGAYRIRDAETGEIREITLNAASAAACRTRAATHAERVRAACLRRGISHAQAFGAGNADAIIMREFPRLGVIS